MRTLLVDDEPLARKELRRLLAAFPWIEIVGEAATATEALARIEALRPGLLLLDIEMPGGTGFDLLARLDDAPRVIFTTAYDQHAVRAFEVNALDYLLKPIDPRRLAAALARLDHAPASPTAPASPVAPVERLFVRDGERCWFVPMREVRLLASEGNYVRLYWNGEQPFLARSLASLEARLDARMFFRVNRHQIVNMDFVAGVELGDGGRLYAQLRGGPEVEISRRRARVFRERAG